MKLAAQVKNLYFKDASMTNAYTLQCTSSCTCKYELGEQGSILTKTKHTCNSNSSLNMYTVFGLVGLDALVIKKCILNVKTFCIDLLYKLGATGYEFC